MPIEQRYEERYSRAINGAADYENCPNANIRTITIRTSGVATAERALRRYLVVMDRIAYAEVE
jgi:hypothetical protein